MSKLHVQRISHTIFAQCFDKVKFVQVFLKTKDILRHTLSIEFQLQRLHCISQNIIKNKMSLHVRLKPVGLYTCGKMSVNASRLNKN